MEGARCAGHRPARAAGRRRTGTATCAPCRCALPAGGRSRRYPGQPPQPAQSPPAAGPGRARAPTVPVPPAPPAPDRTRQSGMGLTGHAFFMPYPRQCPVRDGPSRRGKMTVVARYPGLHQDVSGAAAARPGPRTLAPDRQPADPPPRDLQLHRRDADRRHHPQTVPPALRRLRQPVAVRRLPRQPRRLRRIGLLHRPARRHLPRRPRHRLQPCTSTTPPPGSDPRRTYGRDHLAGGVEAGDGEFAANVIDSWVQYLRDLFDLMPTEGEAGAVNIARRMAAVPEAYRQFSRTLLDAARKQNGRPPAQAAKNSPEPHCCSPTRNPPTSPAPSSPSMAAGQATDRARRLPPARSPEAATVVFSRIEPGGRGGSRCRV